MLLENTTTRRIQPLLVSAAPLRDQNGAIVGGVSVFQDISQLKDLEQQKDDLLATISHDLKNPLATIKGQAQLLMRNLSRARTLESQRLVDGLATIDVTGAKMTSLINQLVDTARLETGRPLDLDLRPTDLVWLAQQVVAEYQQSTDRHQIAIETDDWLPSISSI